MAKKDQDNLCGECGQSVEVVPGHPRNWPRRIVAGASSIREAITAFNANVDEYNDNFAVKEFADACEEKWGEIEAPAAVARS